MPEATTTAPEKVKRGPRGKYNQLRHNRDALPPRRIAELTHCPNCHHNLDAERPRHIGDLWADPRGDTVWKGRMVQLSDTLRILLHTLLTCADYRSRRVVDDGYFVTGLTIAERLDMSTDSAKVYISHLRNRFRSVDPEFDQIEVSWGVGYRWRAVGKAPKAVARSRNGRFVCYDNGTVTVANHRLFLNPRAGGTLEYMKALVSASPEWVSNAKLAEAVMCERNGGRTVQWAMREMRKRLEAAGVEGVTIEAKRGLGYRLVAGADKAAP